MKVVSKKIEMIAYFKKDGRINPIRFRIEEENKCQVMKIRKIISTDLEKLCGNKMLSLVIIVQIVNNNINISNSRDIQR
jgi:hypothetical protein